MAISLMYPAFFLLIPLGHMQSRTKWIRVTSLKLEELVAYLKRPVQHPRQIGFAIFGELFDHGVYSDGLVPQ